MGRTGGRDLLRARQSSFVVMLIAAGWNRDKTMRRATRNETVLAHNRGFWVDSERAGRERGHRVTGGIDEADVEIDRRRPVIRLQEPVPLGGGFARLTGTRRRIGRLDSCPKSR